MRRKKPEKSGNSERWLLTYSDMITLLMIFFIIMYASSNVDKAKYQKIAKSFNQAFGGTASTFKGGTGVLNGSNSVGSTDSKSDNGSNSSSPSDTFNPIASTSSAETAKLQGLKAQIDKYLSDNKLQSSVTTNIEDRGLIVSLKDSLLFDKGKADVKAEYTSKLVTIGKMLNSIDNYIRIEGNTDNDPISTSQFRSNWELSTSRATNVVEILIAQSNVSPARLSSVGYGEYRPVASNSNDDGKAKNRRVDIVIMNDKYSPVESK